MAKKRVYDLAKELGVESKVLLTQLKEMGEFVRSASSTLDPSLVRRLRATGPLRSAPEDVLLPNAKPINNMGNRSGRPTPSEETQERSMERSVRRASSRPRTQSPSDITSGSDDRGYLLHDEATLKYVQRMNNEYPLSLVHRKALRLLKSDFSWARRQPDGSWLALINFGPHVAGVFGFTRGVMAIYSPHPDLQPRLFKALPDALRELPDGRLAEDHIFLVSTPDVTSRRKLDNWSHEVSYTAIAMPNDPDERRVSSSLFEALLGRLANRNLFDESLPVTGSDFFGRRQLLAQLVDEVRQGNVCGVFGLRKTGKTSLLKELGQRYRGSDDQQRIFMLRDLESLPGDPSAISEAFVQDLQASFLTEFRQREIKTHLLADLPAPTTLGEFRRALEYSVKDCQRRGVQIVLALDEIESLMGDANELKNGSRPIVPEILGMLRSLVQENPNFNVVLAGITSSALERGEIYGRENPMFSWAKTFYLPPLSGQDISQLTRDVGRRMAVVWTESALIDMYAQSGGNIFLHRTLAAVIASHLPPPEMTGRLVSSIDVAESIKTWHRSVAQRLRDMLESTERHYPVECELLNSFMHDRVTFDELEGSFPAEVHRLLMLGLLVEDTKRQLELGPLSHHLVATGLA